MMLADKYQITDALHGTSSGKFGKLYKGIVKETGANILIKALSKSSADKSTIDRLRNEASFSFEHDSLPKIVDFFESEEEVILIRSYVVGTSLKEVWKGLKQKDQLPFLEELLAHLEPVFNQLAARNIVHGDIRPGNILISNTKPVKVHLIDFGLAFSIDEPEQRKIIFPLGYAAPELILNRLSVADQRTDIYSLGITIWNLFTGELPLAHRNPSIFTNLQITHPLPDHSRLPIGLFQILQKMAAKYNFKVPPNKMTQQEVDYSLKEGMNLRYNNMSEIINDYRSVQPRWSFYQRISLR